MLATTNHYKVVCKECKVIISQCRCPDPNKSIHYELCIDCKKKEVTKPKQDSSKVEKEWEDLIP